MSFTKFGLIVCVAAILLAGYSKLAIGEKVILHSDSQVKVWQREPLARYLRVHSEDPKTLEVLNRRFPNVRGMKPFYLQATNANMLVFANKSASGEYINVVDLDKKRIHAIEANSLGFGGFIGSGRDPGAPCTDFIVAVSNDVVVLRMTNDKARTDIVVDLLNDKVKSVNYTEQP
jgi:hypothetical protein